MIFLIIWLLGSVVSFMANGYLRGHSDQNFNKNQGVTENPPWIIGQLTCWAWPIQAAFAAIWLLNHLSYGKGKGDGLAFNTEVSQLRKFAAKFRQAEAETFRLMLENNIDPNDLDTQTARAITARAIQWDMEESAAQRREAQGLEVVRRPRDYKIDMAKERPLPRKEKVEEIFEVLDKKGIRVDSPAYNDYWDKKREEEDLVL